MVKAADGSDCGYGAFDEPCDYDAYWGIALELPLEPPFALRIGGDVVAEYSLALSREINEVTTADLAWLRVGSELYCNIWD